MRRVLLSPALLLALVLWGCGGPAARPPAGSPSPSPSAMATTAMPSAPGGMTVADVIALASGSPDLAPRIDAVQPVCGPVDEVLALEVRGTVDVWDSAQQRVQAWQDAGLILEETTVSGTLDGHPVTFEVIGDAQEVPTVGFTIQTDPSFDPTALGGPSPAPPCG